MKRHCWNSGIVACLLVTGLFVSGATVANGQEREKPAVPPEAAVYLAQARFQTLKQDAIAGSMD